MARSEPARHRYRLFGLTLDSDVPFATRLGSADPDAEPDEPDLIYRCRRDPPAGKLPEPVYTSRFKTQTGETALTVHRWQDRLAMRFPERIEFHLRRREITARLPRRAERLEVESYLLGPVMSLWLELRSMLVLHASSVVTEQGGVGFLAAPRAGKSSLAAEFVAHGRPLLGDDLLPIERRDGRWTARSAFPQLRLWPDSCARLTADWRSFERVHPEHQKRRVPVGPGGVGRWHAEPAAMTALYLPERRDDVTAPRIEPLAPRERWLELVRHSFVARAVEALGMQPDRFDLLTGVATEVPVRRLLLPPGLDRLGEARRVVEADVAALDD